MPAEIREAGIPHGGEDEWQIGSSPTVLVAGEGRPGENRRRESELRLLEVHCKEVRVDRRQQAPLDRGRENLSVLQRRKAKRPKRGVAREVRHCFVVVVLEAEPSPNDFVAYDGHLACDRAAGKVTAFWANEDQLPTTGSGWRCLKR